MGLRLCILVQVIVLCAHINATISDNNYAASSWKTSLDSIGLSPLHKLYKCVEKDASTSIEECLSTQLVVLLDQMVHQQRVPLIEGVEFVSKQNILRRPYSGEQMLTEDNLESLLPRSTDTRQGILDSLMLHKLFNFFKTHRLQLDLPDGRTLKASKIKKLLLPFLVGVVLKFASVVPVILSIMGVLAMNALLAGKAALILTGFTGIRTFLQKGNYNEQNKGTHFIHHDLGTPSVGHGVANLIHSLGLNHQHGRHGYRETHEAAGSHGDVLHARSFTGVQNESVNTDKNRSAKMDEHRFTNTENPQHIQNFHYPGLMKSLVI